MIAEYLMIDTDALDSLMDLGNEALFDKLVELEESKKFEAIDIDKVWDALHYFLTGVSAGTPIDANKLSEAVVGIHNFILDDEAYFITCIENDELPMVITALEGFDFDAQASQFEPQALKKYNIYPMGIWNDDKDQLLIQFKLFISLLINFYKQAFEMRHHVIVSIL